jgi:hypothetical protein
MRATLVLAALLLGFGVSVSAAEPDVAATEAAPVASPTPPEQPAPAAEPDPPMEPVPSPQTGARPAGFGNAVCQMIESAATLHGIPAEFFVRLIWKESSFNPRAVSPKGARGIAQFMPATATERGLLDPFDPVEAIPKSAQLLRDLRGQFGNLGLAAAAYNAGPRRVQDWLDGRSGLPWETQDYVRAITGRPAEDWAAARGGGDAQVPPGGAEMRKSCTELAALLARRARPLPLESTAPAGSAPPAEPWGVQLAGNFSRNVVLRSVAEMRKRFPAILGSHEPSIIASRLGGRGRAAFYRARVGANTRQYAEKLCGQLRAAGGSCVVLHN